MPSGLAMERAEEQRAAFEKTTRKVMEDNINMDKQMEAFNKLKKEGLTLQHKLPIKASDGEIKEDNLIIGDRKHKAEAKEVLKDESKMVKEIRELEEKRKHKPLSGKQVDNLLADKVNLDTVHPELHERVHPRVIPDEMTEKKTRQILNR